MAHKKFYWQDNILTKQFFKSLNNIFGFIFKNFKNENFSNWKYFRFRIRWNKLTVWRIYNFIKTTCSWGFHIILKNKYFKKEREFTQKLCNKIRMRNYIKKYFKTRIKIPVERKLDAWSHCWPQNHYYAWLLRIGTHSASPSSPGWGCLWAWMWPPGCWLWRTGPLFVVATLIRFQDLWQPFDLYF